MDALEKCRALESEAKARREAMRSAFPELAATVDAFREVGMHPVGVTLHTQTGTQVYGQPISRYTDPESSHRAGQQLIESGEHAMQKEAVLALVRAKPDSTSRELARLAEMASVPLDRYDIARRLPDLEKDGRVTRSGMRDCRVTGKRAVTWRAV